MRRVSFCCGIISGCGAVRITPTYTWRIAMPAKSSAETSPRLLPSFDLSVGQRITMVCLAYVPLLHVMLCIGVAAIVLRSVGVAWAIPACLATLYLLPPVAVAMARPRATLKA